MQLAADEITIRVGHEEIHLRPTLRVALRLERRHGGFANIIRAVSDENLTMIADVIRESADVRSTIPEIIEEIGCKGLRIQSEVLVAPIIKHVLALAGVDADAPQSEERAGNPITFTDHHAQLYRVATGWLGWTPETAWESTPAEIIEAHRGRMELLNAVFGGAANVADEPFDPSDVDRDEAGWQRIKNLVALGGNKAR